MELALYTAVIVVEKLNRPNLNSNHLITNRNRQFQTCFFDGNSSNTFQFNGYWLKWSKECLPSLNQWRIYVETRKAIATGLGIVSEYLIEPPKMLHFEVSKNLNAPLPWSSTIAICNEKPIHSKLSVESLMFNQNILIVMENFRSCLKSTLLTSRFIFNSLQNFFAPTDCFFSLFSFHFIAFFVCIFHFFFLLLYFNHLQTFKYLQWEQISIHAMKLINSLTLNEKWISIHSHSMACEFLYIWA